VNLGKLHKLVGFCSEKLGVNLLELHSEYVMTLRRKETAFFTPNSHHKLGED
jgi:hypothetical protein